jgi:hypothetical protein
MFSGSVYLGIMLAYFATWGSSLHINQNSAAAWVVPTTMHIMFAGIVFILSFFNYESPRYLIKKHQEEHAIANLVRIRGLPADNPHIRTEIRDIEIKLDEEKEAYRGQGFFGYIREIFLPNNFYRVYLGLGTQLLGQWSGANSITVYASSMFALLGTKGQNEQ